MNEISTVLLVYIPSLIGLIAIEIYFLNLLYQSLKCKSGATPVILSSVLLGVAKFVSWGAIVFQSIILIQNGHIVFNSWELLFVPIFWVVTNITILFLLHRDPAKYMEDKK